MRFEMFITTHVLGAILGEVLAVAASLVALLHLAQRKSLREKKLLYLFQKMPALEFSAKLLLGLLWLGFCFLSLALASGIFFFCGDADIAPDALFSKLIWALLVWAWYLVTLLGWHYFHVSTKNLAKMSLFGFLLLLTAYFGFIFFPEGN